MYEQPYTCTFCGWTAPEDDPETERDHCPNCLSGYHAKGAEDYECGGELEAISLWVQSKTEGEIIQRCSFCGELCTCRIRPDDNPIKLMSVAMKPLANPPFPIERLEELTGLMGGQGDVSGYHED